MSISVLQVTVMEDEEKNGEAESMHQSETSLVAENKRQREEITDLQEDVDDKNATINAYVCRDTAQNDELQGGRKKAVAVSLSILTVVSMDAMWLDIFVLSLTEI